jgi:hypothetical protein
MNVMKKVSDEGMKEIAKLTNLNSLYLYGTNVTDAGLNELLALKNLTTLNLGYTKVTDTGLIELAKLKNLKTLDISRFTWGSITFEGVKELQKALPDCKITK